MKYLTGEWLERHDACYAARWTFKDNYPTDKALISDVVRALEEQEEVDWLLSLMVRDVAMLKSILNLGVSYSLKGEDEYTLLMNAVYYQKEAVVVYLIGLGADVNARDELDGSVLGVANYRIRHPLDSQSDSVARRAKRIFRILQRAGAE